MKSAKVLLSLAGAGLFAVGCAATPPPELKDARAQYNAARNDPAAALVPGDLRDAKLALEEAERRFDDEGDEPSTRHAAYIASRKAMSAHAKAETVGAIQEKQAAVQGFEQYQQQRTASMQGQLQQQKTTLQQQKTALQGVSQELESARQARAAADQRANEALAMIEGLKSQQSDKGTVLSLSGSVLFATGKSVLLPAARERLAQVAKALKEDQRAITIVGHTDAAGADDANQKLSEQRADAVRKFLITQGIEEGRVKSIGMGESEPIASNDSPEGRANNRRVELVLQDPQQAASHGQGHGQQPQGQAQPTQQP